ncbi:MAG TPA: TIM-barrel domain-containing protein, partial [Cytophagaceae bacterium]
METIAEQFGFKKVEEFFEDNGSSINYRNWASLQEVVNYELLKDQDTVVFYFINNEGNPCCLELRFITPYTLRVRFNPAKQYAGQYTLANTNSIVTDTIKELSGKLDDVDLTIEEVNGVINIFIKDRKCGQNTMMVSVNRNPYRMTVYKARKDGSFFKAHEDGETAIYYKKRLCYTGYNEHTVEYSIIQAKAMTPTARYLGFGEKGGYNLVRNGARMTYFNFDNMRYSQIYGGGPLDIREPLYDSNPFFMEFNAVPEEELVTGLFIDNTSETLLDLGSYNFDQQYLFGSMYGDLDYYFFLGNTSEDVLKSYVSLVGKTKLKPRFILGYHQGCYGYENFNDLQDAVNGYRGNEIPLDGLHVDVDIQKNHCTFTIDESKFPADTFDILAKQGIKCSTNITPVVSYVNNYYKTYESANKNEYFVKADRITSTNINGSNYYSGGVYYGGNRGTFGHYPDLGKFDVRLWWGQQYRLLYERGLQMVWQDMTTPCIPNPEENRDTEIWVEKYQQYWKIGDHITGNMRSFPFDLWLTDNSLKKYNGEVAWKSRGLTKSPAARIRNLYSYNLQKATYHGLSNLWRIYVNTFTVVGENGLTTQEAYQIINALEDRNIIIKVEEAPLQYEVNPSVNLNDPNLDLGIPENLMHIPFVKEEVLAILKQSVEIEKRRRNKRNFIIGRGGFAGTHRFGGLWTGDNASSWDFLKINITQVLALGISGQSMSGQDIGGFERENDYQKWADPELMIRWTAAGAFLPWFRNHYIKKGQKLFQEPYKYQDYANQVGEQERYMYYAVLPVCKYYIQLRYKLLPLLYDGMFENVITGLPFVKAMFLTDGHDKSLFDTNINFLNNQFFVGNDLLIAPVIEKENWGAYGRRDVYLPAGSKWYAFKNNRQKLSAVIEGGSVVRGYDAHISTDPDHIPFIVPMYVRE